MSAFWRVSAKSTAAAHAEKEDNAFQPMPRLLGYSVSQYAASTAAGVEVVLREGVSSTAITSSAVVGVMGAATEFAPVSAYSSAGLARAPYISVRVSASVATSTQVVTIWGDYG